MIYHEDCFGALMWCKAVCTYRTHVHYSNKSLLHVDGLLVAPIVGACEEEYVGEHSGNTARTQEAVTLGRCERSASMDVGHDFS